MTDQTLPSTPEPDSQPPTQRRAAWGLLLQQLTAARAGKPLKRVKPNPRPAGVIRPGSATDDVLRLMRANPLRPWRRAQLVMLTGRTESSIDWALIYLRRQGLICTEELSTGPSNSHRLIHRLRTDVHPSRSATKAAAHT